MTLKVTLPQLGESVETGTIVAWLVEVGDEVAVEQPIAEISTDKVDTEVPSPAAGRVVAILAAVDEEVAVGAPILELSTADGEPAGVDDAPGDGGRTADDAPAPTAVTARTAPARGAGPGASTAGMRLSPLVRRLLRERGLDPAGVAGTGPDGRITPEDVAAAGGPAAPPTARPTAPTAPTVSARGAARADRPERTPGGRVEPLSRTRRIIAERMLDSLRTTAQLTSAVEADLTHVMTIRERTKGPARERYGVALSPLAFIAHATVRTLADHPLLNASIDVEAGEVVHHGSVGLGIAVDAPQGLIVPVIRDAERLNPLELQQRIADLAARARERRLSPDDLRGGTFTITNTGSRGSLFDTPILNPPEVGILATPAIEKRPVILTDERGRDAFAIRYRSYLCLTYDHRLVDGADAARFLGDLATRIDSREWGPEVSGLLEATPD